MRPDPCGEETVSKGELDELLADATATTPEKIEQGADNIKIGPPEEADIVETEE